MDVGPRDEMKVGYDLILSTPRLLVRTDKIAVGGKFWG
jgi:hypothetical protein